METMFGVLVAGRMVQTTAQQVPPNKFVFTVAEASRVHTVAVFLTGTMALPDGYGASVWLAWPSAIQGSTPNWRFLGFLTSAKPSAVFRIRSDSSTDTPETTVAAMLGISVEPLEAIEATMVQLQITEGASLSTQQLTYEAVSELPRKLVQHFFEFITSYATANPQSAAAHSQGTEWIPAWVASKWYQAITARLSRDPSAFR